MISKWLQKTVKYNEKIEELLLDFLVSCIVFLIGFGLYVIIKHILI